MTAAPAAAAAHPAASNTNASAAPPPYIAAPSFSKRVQALSAGGQEERADDNPWVHMQLTDPFQQTLNGHDADAAAAAAGAAATTGGDAGPAAAAAGDGSAAGPSAAAAAAEDEAEAPPRPDEVVKAFVAAKGELEWLQAMLNTLLEGRYLTVGRSERSQGLQRIADLAIAANSRFRRRTAAAASAASALSEGASALAALGRQEDAFYEQVARLQRYWKVRQEPAGSPYAYSVNLALNRGGSQQQQQQQPGGAEARGGGGSSTATNTANTGGGGEASPEEAAAMIGRGPVSVVYILKDPAGMLRVQVPPPQAPGPPTVTFKAVEEPPAVYTGPSAIHGLLLQQLRLNTWHAALACLDEEIVHMLGLPPRLRPLRTLTATASATMQQQQPTWAQAQQQQQQQRQGSDVSALAADFGRTSSLPAVPPGQQQAQQQQQQQQQHPAFAAGGHLTFYATLSSLGLQAVAGAAATAGEAAVLQQQQQQRGRQRRRQQQQQGRQGGTSAVEASCSSLSEGDGALLAAGDWEDVDVGEPWNRAAAEAAAAMARAQPPSAAAAAADAGPEGAAADAADGGDVGTAVGGAAGAAAGAAAAGAHVAASGGGCSLVSGVCGDPQLLSLRPLVLDHLLITQLGHLLSGHLGSASNPTALAAVTYAATARQILERARQATKRQQQQQAPGGGGGGGSRDDAGAAAMGAARGAGSGGAAAGTGGSGGAGAGAAAAGSFKPGSYMFGATVSFMTCLSRWLAHMAARDVLRYKVDGVLAAQPGFCARALASSHTCVSALQVVPTADELAWSGGGGGGGGYGYGHGVDAGAAAEGGAAGAAAATGARRGPPPPRPAVPPAPLLLLLSDSLLSIEGSCLAAGAGAGAGAGQGGVDPWQGSPAQNAALSVQLQALPGVLTQLLPQRQQR